MQFLIVDDDAMSRRIAELLLKPYGTCVCVENGEEALAAHSKSIDEGNPFSVIYLDMRMPGLSGIEILEKMRKIESERKGVQEVPVVMLTGDAQVGRIAQAHSLGIVEYLMKPISEERLVQGLERLDLVDRSYGTE